MPLYEVTGSGLRQREAAQFAALGLYERANLQRMLRDDPSALGEDLLIVAEEFGRWEDARRRIDLLALDRSGRLVVIELKRTDDGGHMELQAIRYAAMVSSMGFEDVVQAYAAHRAKQPPGDEFDARSEIAAFLGSDEAEDAEPVISTDVRILLVSADFGREITTAVLWLNRFDGMDIRCIRLVPYDVDGKVLLDIQQVIPLPEAADYQVRLRRKGAAIERAARPDGRDFTRYHVVVDGEALPDANKRNAVRLMVSRLAERGVRLDDIRKVLPPSRMRVLPGVLSDPDDVRSALIADAPDTDVRRWFTDHPFPDREDGRTYVLFRQWGRNTEPALAALAAAFPEAKVTYRAAESMD